ncbi:MAG: UbiA family prenyltransferase, partial [Hyphomicrobium sp.]
MTSAASVREPALRGAVSANEFIGIFKPRIAVAIMASALAGIAITPGGMPGALEVVTLAVGVFLAAGAAGAFNQWAEADLDALMARTAGRPFASGRLRADTTWLVGIGALLGLAVGMVALSSNTSAALYTFLGAFTY